MLTLRDDEPVGDYPRVPDRAEWRFLQGVWLGLLVGSVLMWLAKP